MGPARAKTLGDELKIFTVRDLLYTFPYKYIDRTVIHTINRLQEDMPYVQLKGHIINLIYKGDHYSYVVRTEEDEDFIVSDEYLWNMDDYVSLLIPKEKFQYAIKK